MQKIDSDALGIITKALGLAGAGAQITEFADGLLNQGLDIAPLIRRGRTQGVTGGWYYGIMRNVHTDAETLETIVDPFNVGTAAVAPYPPIIDTSQFDVWLIGAGVRQDTGAGTLTARLAIDPRASSQGWGITDGDVVITDADNFAVAFWDSVITQTDEFALTEAGQPLVNFGLRLPSACTLRFSSTSSLTATFTCKVLLGVFPIGLGQDILA